MHSRDHRRAPSLAQNARFFGSGMLAATPIICSAFLQLVLPFFNAERGTRIENITFWPLIAAMVGILLVANFALLDRKFLRSLPVLSLAAYFLFAGASVTWAYDPDIAFKRYSLQLFLFIVALLPYALPIRTHATIPALHVVYLGAMIMHAYCILTYPPSPLGHTGYFSHKQELGMFGAVSLMISLYEIFNQGWRRYAGLIGACTAIWMLLASESKGALAIAIFSVAASVFVLLACKFLRTTPAYIAAAFIVMVSAYTSTPMEWIGYNLYGDPTVTGRTYIWDFINYQISQKSWFGWGFHSYWDVPNSPHLAAWGFVKDMPSSHSGYMELKLETGHIGYWIFVVFLFATLHMVERVRRKDPLRAWLFLSIMLYAQLNNLIDSIWLWMNQLWFLYLILVGETLGFARATAPSTLAVRRPNHVHATAKAPRLAQP
jgi:exopolysaccharide production protein ExoQ